MTTNTKQVLVVVPLWIASAMFFQISHPWWFRLIATGTFLLSLAFVWWTNKREKSPRRRAEGGRNRTPAGPGAISPKSILPPRPPEAHQPR